MHGGSDIKADPVDQRRLLDLQAVDTETARLQHRRRSLPEHVDIAQSKQQRLAVMEELVENETLVSDLERAQRKAEADLEPVRQRRVRDQERIDGGAVTDPKQLSALIDEVEHLGRRIGELEDAELELMGKLEEVQAVVQRLSAKKAELETQLRSWMASRDKQVASLDTELKAQAEEREGLLAVLPPDLVASYEKVRNSHDGFGAAELQHGRCSGCRLDANAADLRAYAAAPADQVIRCEECGRILVRTENSGL
ncbi:zinc ribbon domain-containing protein [Naumannella halotolerans]|uniref:zinc ribbon domain-containing protein n=1 Tax=Naumannella halotolerans TaxID=993414 RepID=UPI00370D7441